MIPRDFIQELLNRLDIVDVVERYVSLKKTGANYAACCPFHSEKSPSFTVSPSKQFYHCFGCGAHGTAISFVMEYAGLGFVETINELASSAGMQVPEQEVAVFEQRVGASSFDDLTQMMLAATHFYRDQLKQSETAIAYLKKRGLSGEIAARFGIGYAPLGWQSLAAVYSDYQAKTLMGSGLVIESEDGKRYDRFRDRIMFPIQNQRGRVIGFGGRVLGQGEPKYLNSPETSLFEKGQELYGLFLARKAIREAGQVLVVEGYMDVVALAQHGVEYAVATLGTATTAVHVQKLLRQSDRVIFCFDGDDAGRRAAWRALENSLNQVADGKELAFLFLPQGEDPDSYIRQNGKADFESLLRQAVPLSEFLVRDLAARVDMQTQEGKSRFLQSAKPLLEQIHAPMLSLMLRKRLAKLADIDQTELDSLFQIKPLHRRAAPMKLPRNAPAAPCRMLIHCILFQPEFARELSNVLLDERDPEQKALIALREFIQDHLQASSTAALLDHFRDSPYAGLLQKAASEIMHWNDGFDVLAEFKGALEKLQANQRNQQIDELLNQDRAGHLSQAGKLELRQLLQRSGTMAEK